MTSPTHIQFQDEDGQTFDILVQNSNNPSQPQDPTPHSPENPSADDDDEYDESMGIKAAAKDMVQKVRTVPLAAFHSTIQTYTRIAIGAFQNFPDVNIEEVTLKFGISLEGSAGLPVMLTGGSAGANFEIEVKCKPKAKQP